MVKKIILLFILGLSLYSFSIFISNKDLELNYVGLEKLSSNDLDKLISSFNFSYFSDNRKQIKKVIKQNSIVESVEVQRCSYFSLKCYLVEISESVPSFLIHESDTKKNYFFSQTGKQMYSSNAIFKTGKLNSYYNREDFVEYVTEEKLASFYLYDANVNYILYSLDLLKKNKINILKVELIGKKLQKVFIQDLTFPIIFSFNSSKKEILEVELERLKAILKDLDGNYSDVMAINLSFGKVGSVMYSKVSAN